jgi:post-segregation antitoxin (ccd killing protein)
VERKTKPNRRRATVYLDLDVTRALLQHCQRRDVEMSAVVNDALRAYLAARG